MSWCNMGMGQFIKMNSTRSLRQNKSQSYEQDRTDNRHYDERRFTRQH